MKFNICVIAFVLVQLAVADVAVKSSISALSLANSAFSSLARLVPDYYKKMDEVRTSELGFTLLGNGSVLTKMNVVVSYRNKKHKTQVSSSTPLSLQLK